MADLKSGTLRVGDSAHLDLEITEDLVAKFVALTGDTNPLHMSDEYARTMGFGERVVHGMAYASSISTLIGMHLPGPGALWASQEIHWAIPVRIGDRVRLTASVSAMSIGVRTVSLSVVAENQRGEQVLSGTARVVLPRELESTANPAGVEGSSYAAASAAPKHRTALVTGASGAVGRATARSLAAQGFNVALHFNSEAAAAEALRAELKSEFPAATFVTVAGDLTEPAAAREIVVSTRAAAGDPSVLILCASPPPTNIPFASLEWRRDLEPHLMAGAGSAVSLINECASFMKETRFGRVVGILSNVLVGEPPKSWAAYVAGKAALQSILRSAVSELGPYGITVNSILPGMMESAMTGDVSERVKAIEARRANTRRLTTPADVAQLVSYLVSDAAQQLTGASLTLDGGAAR